MRRSPAGTRAARHTGFFPLRDNFARKGRLFFYRNSGSLRIWPAVAASHIGPREHYPQSPPSSAHAPANRFDPQGRPVARGWDLPGRALSLAGGDLLPRNLRGRRAAIAGDAAHRRLAHRSGHARWRRLPFRGRLRVAGWRPASDYRDHGPPRSPDVGVARSAPDWRRVSFDMGPIPPKLASAWLVERVEAWKSQGAENFQVV